MWRGHTASALQEHSIVLNVMQPTALRRIDAITKKPNSTFFGYFTGYLTEFSLCFTPCISMTKWNIQLKRGSKDRYLKELSKEYNIVTLIFELS